MTAPSKGQVSVDLDMYTPKDVEDATPYANAGQGSKIRNIDVSRKAFRETKHIPAECLLQRLALPTASHRYPFDDSTGPEASSVLKELRELCDHPLASAWDHGLVDVLLRDLNTMRVDWTSIDAVRIAEVGESSGLATVWIGVEFGALSFEEGSAVAFKCRTNPESRVMRQAGNRFLDPVPLSDPTFMARDPYTATLGIPISAKDRPWAEGTDGFYLSTGGDDKDIYLVTALHVVLPLEQDDNNECEHTNTSKTREDVVILGTSGFNEKLAAIDYEIRGQEYAFTDADERIESVQDMDDLRSAGAGLKALHALRRGIATQWGAKEKRVFGELAWPPPLVLSTDPGQYTLDLAVIKIDAGTLDAENYRGNTINIGNEYTREQFLDKVRLHHTSPVSFRFPANRLVALEDQVPESALAKPPMLDVNGDRCLIVFKNGAKTGTTIGRANNLLCRPVPGVEGMAGHSYRLFSAKGDSGSCLANAFGRVGGIITGGTSGPSATDSADVSYVTPISFIMKVLHNTKRFEHAHLNPVLA
ncbi:hypothetical protein NEOLEDRAFT_1153698 [Neolentinus lepideus HHB14362 ss-1]|uniref:Trypsin-like serine protease n=1 Tax=Neolentinus lepideus HHB14362 ss-1 TaxID=1314782 RepID=A0A165VKD6_9AGAM|nr:hypothetical protein NEOLEDRAFT_1153698 [Neolentinus lepideus HHB14362 ss-1]